MVFDRVSFFNVSQNYYEISSNDNGVFEIYMINIEIIVKSSNFSLNSLSNTYYISKKIQYIKVYLMKITSNFDSITFFDIYFIDNIVFHEIIYIELALKLSLNHICCRMRNNIMGSFLEIHNVLSIYIDNTSISESFLYTESGQIKIIDSINILNNLQDIFLFPINLMNVYNNFNHMIYILILFK